MRRLLIGLLSLFFCLIPLSSSWSKSARTKMTPVEKNVQRLLSTKTCPGCDLSGADLRQSILTKANLNGANLSGAKLNLADLSGANLRQAILFETDLSGADLSFADLNGAEFRGTIFEGAQFKHTQLKGQTVNRLIHAEQAQLEVYEFAPPKELIVALESPPAAARSARHSAPAAASKPAAPPRYAKAAIKPAPIKKQGHLRMFPTKIAVDPLGKFSAPAAGLPDPKKVAALEKKNRQAQTN